jgi:hypothetical protein
MTHHLELYRLGKDDACEWFATLEEAEARREDLYEAPYTEGRSTDEFDIERVWIDRPLTKDLLLNVLNHQGWATGRELVTT